MRNCSVSYHGNGLDPRVVSRAGSAFRCLPLGATERPAYGIGKRMQKIGFQPGAPQSHLHAGSLDLPPLLSRYFMAYHLRRFCNSLSYVRESLGPAQGGDASRPFGQHIDSLQNMKKNRKVFAPKGKNTNKHI